jgi:hypothetical protein
VNLQSVKQTAVRNAAAQDNPANRSRTWWTVSKSGPSTTLVLVQFLADGIARFAALFCFL